MRKLLSIPNVAVVLVVVLATCWLGTKIRTGIQNAVASREEWRQFTTPLPADTVMDLCQRLELTSTSELCAEGAVAYSGDFYPYIRERLAIDQERTIDYEEVMNLLGSYLVECESPVTLSTGETYYACSFDLRGDDIYHIGAFFRGDDTLLRLTTSLEWP